MTLSKAYQPKETEGKIYALWERGGFFKPQKIKNKKPFTILLPPPNANAPLHLGHALYVVEDILCRWHRLQGEPVLFLPGTDHAGIETQYVFEKELAKKGRSRFDYDRHTLYKMINDFVEENRGLAKKQLKRLGFMLDWSREKYTLDPDVLKIVEDTFRQLHRDGLVYRAERLANYCPHCGTAFSELEVIYQERKDPLYYMRYGPFVLATVRPETKFGDTAVCVNPKDKRYQKWVGKEFTYHSLIGPRKMKVISDELIDPDFGTGVVKVTPAHDPNDFEIAQRHGLPILKVIDEDGKLNQNTGRFAGLTVNEARKKVVRELKEKGELVRVDHDYLHRVATCYRCKNILEPLLLPQWYVKIKPLAEPALKAVKGGRVQIIPKSFEKLYLQWMEKIKDWNISRQIVWGPRIPAWYCLGCNPDITVEFLDKKRKRVAGKYKELKGKYSFTEIKGGLQQLTAPKEAVYSLANKPCQKCRSKDLLQETDTFDTWFSSGQWPLTTLGFPKGADFKTFYPTSVLDTMWDILFFWVARMIMLGIYRTGRVPFKVAHMHSRVVDKKGQKMSKSRENVTDPMVLVEKYSADALRLALIFGTAPGNDITLEEDKVRAMRNFSNKLWNIARFLLLNLESVKAEIAPSRPRKTKAWRKEDQRIIKDLAKSIRDTSALLKAYRLGQAAEMLYHFVWHRLADEYVEHAKERLRQGETTPLPILGYVYLTCLKLLHPFIPFVTEAIYQKLPLKDKKKSLMIERWPKGQW